MYRFGIDLGGTKIEGVILDEENKQLFRERLPTEQQQGYAHILQNVKSLYDRMRKEIADARHTLGIGTPGSISPKTARVRNANTQCLNGQLVQHDLEKQLGRKISMQNDANCFAMAEAVHGAGQGYDFVFGVIMGTGCGGGLVYKKQLFSGRHAIAGEWGHMSLDPAGPECWCGQKGCVETLISGSGLERLFLEKTGKKTSMQQIVQRYRDGHKAEAELMEVFLNQFGRALANVVNLLDPDVVVLGGGLSNIDELYTVGRELVRQTAFSDFVETPILKNSLGDSAGVLGAAFIGI